MNWWKSKSIKQQKNRAMMNSRCCRHTWKTLFPEAMPFTKWPNSNDICVNDFWIVCIATKKDITFPVDSFLIDSMYPPMPSVSNTIPFKNMFVPAYNEDTIILNPRWSFSRAFEQLLYVLGREQYRIPTVCTTVRWSSPRGRTSHTRTPPYRTILPFSCSRSSLPRELLTKRPVNMRWWFSWHDTMFTTQ